MGTVIRSVRFASLLACAAWVVSLVGFFEGERAGFHSIEDSRRIVFSEVDADCGADRQVLPRADAPDNPTDAAFSLSDGSSIGSLRRSSPLRNGIGRLPTAADQLVAATVLRP